MLNSIKQIYRTPVKLVLFIIAMIVSSMILVLGIVLLLYTNAELNALEESYTTIGTVEQKKVLQKFILCGMQQQKRTNIFKCQCTKK